MVDRLYLVLTIQHVPPPFFSVQTPGFSLALGLVVHGLSMSGHGKAEDLHPRLLAAWIKILLAEVPQPPETTNKRASSLGCWQKPHQTRQTPQRWSLCSDHVQLRGVFSRTVTAFVLQGCPTMQRLAAVNGLVALVGSESYLAQVRRPHVSSREVSRRVKG